MLPVLQIDAWKITQALKASTHQPPASTDEQQQQQQDAGSAVPRKCMSVEPLLPLPYGPVDKGSFRVDWMYDVWGYPYLPN
jgi:hypothetical protein